MNQRIRELAEQANAFARENVEYSRTEDFEIFTEKLYEVSREKFAELIVQECMNVLHDNELWNRHISHVLKEHFGVEE